MNDERLEGEVRTALQKDDPGPVRDELRRRIAAVPDAMPTRRNLVRSPHVSGWMASLRAVAAVVVVGAIIVAALGLRGSNLGPASSASPSATPTGPAPSGSAATPTPSATPVTAPSATSPITGDWHGLRWSAPSAFPGAQAIDDIVTWNGGYIAAAQVQRDNPNQQPGFWSSSDATTWTRLNIDTTAFPDSQINGLVHTASGLLAWGWAGEPVCSGSGEGGTTCEPRPVMLWTSPDGVSWTQVADISTFKGATIEGVTAGSQGLVAVGDTGWNKTAIWVSATGAAWQRLTLPAAGFKDAHFSSVSATSWGYVAGGAVGGQAPVCCVSLPSTGVAAAWWSTDGQTWTRASVQRTGGVGSDLGAIAVGAQGMVAVGSASGGKSGSTAWTSTDGRTWKPIALAPDIAYFGAPAVSPGVPTLPAYTIEGDGARLIAVGQDAAFQLAIWTSLDGLDWQQLTFSGATAAIPSTIDDYMVPGGLIAVGAAGGSQTGTSWLITALP